MVKQTVIRLSRKGQTLAEMLNLPPETRLIDCGIRGAITVRKGRRYVEQEVRK